LRLYFFAFVATPAVHETRHARLPEELLRAAWRGLMRVSGSVKSCHSATLLFGGHPPGEPVTESGSAEERGDLLLRCGNLWLECLHGHLILRDRAQEAIRRLHGANLF